MSSTKEIRTKIKSIQSTQKITRAMQMVAASKMRKAQDRMAATKPYSTHIRYVVAHIAKSRPEYRHIYMTQRDVKSVGFIVVSTDRGLCGGLNINLFKATLQAIQKWQQAGVDVKLCLIGAKAEAFFKRHGSKVLACTVHIGDKPNVVDLIGSVKSMLDACEDGAIDKLFVTSNLFVNTMTQRPTVQQLLPLPPTEESFYDYYWDYIYEPDAKEILTQLLKRYIEVQVYQSVVENIACEQAARMVAMKSATDNAGELISQFKLAYNKARQSAITQELSEIIAGAAAV